MASAIRRWAPDPSRSWLALGLARRQADQHARYDPQAVTSRLHCCCTRQCARLVDKWVSMIEPEPRALGTHSLRWAKVAQIYKKTSNLLL